MCPNPIDMPELKSARPNVIVVDDDPEMRDSTALMLEGLGYAPVPLDEPSRLFDAIRRARPVAILQDLRMPGLNVAGIVAGLRSDPSTSQIPIVFFSANPDVAHTAARYEAWGYLEKPFTKEQLGQVLRSATVPATGAAADASLRRDMRNSFHEYWNTLGALGNYVSHLRGDPKLDPEEQKVARSLEDLVLKLESQTQRLQTYIMSVVEAESPPPVEADGSS